MGACHAFNKGRAGCGGAHTDPGVFQHTSSGGASVGFKPSNPHETLFPATKIFPELRYIWKVLENPTGRRLGQESAFSHAIQEALNRKTFALQGSPALGAGEPW